MSVMSSGVREGFWAGESDRSGRSPHPIYYLPFSIHDPFSTIHSLFLLEGEVLRTDAWPCESP